MDRGIFGRQMFTCSYFDWGFWLGILIGHWPAQIKTWSNFTLSDARSPLTILSTVWIERTHSLCHAAVVKYFVSRKRSTLDGCSFSFLNIFHRISTCQIRLWPGAVAYLILNIWETICILLLNARKKLKPKFRGINYSLKWLIQTSESPVFYLYDKNIWCRILQPF